MPVVTAGELTEGRIEVRAWRPMACYWCVMRM